MKKIIITICVALLSFAVVAAPVANTADGGGVENENLSKSVYIPSDVSEEWRPLVDPSKREFWNEGNRVPDEGFLKMATNPTPETIRNWLIRVENRNRVIRLINEISPAVVADLVRKGVITPDIAPLTAKVEARIGNSSSLKKPSLAGRMPDVSKIKVDFLFASYCQYCAELAPRLEGLKNLSVIQADVNAPLKNFNNLPKSKPISKGDMKEFFSNDEGVPQLVIYNPENKKQRRVLNGVVSTEEIIATIAAVAAEQEG